MFKWRMRRELLRSWCFAHDYLVTAQSTCQSSCKMFKTFSWELLNTDCLTPLLSPSKASQHSFIKTKHLTPISCKKRSRNVVRKRTIKLNHYNCTTIGLFSPENTNGFCGCLLVLLIFSKLSNPMSVLSISWEIFWGYNWGQSIWSKDPFQLHFFRLLPLENNDLMMKVIFIFYSPGISSSQQRSSSSSPSHQEALTKYLLTKLLGNNDNEPQSPFSQRRDSDSSFRFPLVSEWGLISGVLYNHKNINNSEKPRSAAKTVGSCQSQHRRYRFQKSRQKGLFAMFCSHS